MDQKKVIGKSSSSSSSQSSQSSSQALKPCPYCPCPFTDKDHLARYSHRPERKDCPLGSSCKLVGDESHTSQYSHVCIQGSTCLLIDDPSHSKIYSHEGELRSSPSPTSPRVKENDDDSLRTDDEFPQQARRTPQPKATVAEVKEWSEQEVLAWVSESKVSSDSRVKEAFAKNPIDGGVLLELNADGLKEMGITGILCSKVLAEIRKFKTE